MGGGGDRFFWSGRKEFANLKAQQQTKNKASSKQQQSKNKTVEVSFAMQHVTGSYMGLYLHSPQTGNTYQGPNLSYYRLSLKQNILMRARLVNFQVPIT